MKTKVKTHKKTHKKPWDKLTEEERKAEIAEMIDDCNKAVQVYRYMGLNGYAQTQFLGLATLCYLIRTGKLGPVIRIYDGYNE